MKLWDYVLIVVVTTMFLFYFLYKRYKQQQNNKKTQQEKEYQYYLQNLQQKLINEEINKELENLKNINQFLNLPNLLLLWGHLLQAFGLPFLLI